MRVRRVSRGEGGAVPDLNGRADIGRCGFDHPRSKNQSRSHGEYTCINSSVTIALIPVESQFERSREIEERVGRGGDGSWRDRSEVSWGFGPPAAILAAEQKHTSDNWKICTPEIKV